MGEGGREGEGEHLSWRLALLLLFLAVVVPAGALAAVGRFDGLYGQDPYAYYDYAVGPLRAGLLRLRPPPDFYWPPGYPLLVALVSFAVGARPLAGQLVSLVAGGLAAVGTALLAREVWPALDGRGGARARFYGPLLAGLVVALCGQLWQSSIVVMADTTGLAAATLGAWALARYGRRGASGGVGWLALAAAGLSWAVLTRWAYALVAIPCTVYALVALRRRGRPVALAHGAAATAVVAVLLGPLLVPVAIGLLEPGRTAPFAADLDVYRWDPLNAARRAFHTADGLLAYRWPNGLYYALAPALPFFFTPLLAWLIAPGLWTTLRRRATAGLVLVVGWAGVTYAFHAGAPWQNIRFVLAYLPPLAVLLALGAVVACRAVGRHGRALVGVGLAAGLAWMTVGGVGLTRGFIARKDADLALARAVRLPADARLLTFGPTLTFQHYTAIETDDLSGLTPPDLARLAAGDHPVYLLLDTANVETQWRGLPPDENYRWLRDGPGLAPLGRYGGHYTLFRVGRAAGGHAP
ncbi:MAG TPA: hypothetical protein VFW96_24240 [Thermomicrobiales bacterium]|nr:hypothetical protein [Thermomicrobiales bacterium]